MTVIAPYQSEGRKIIVNQRVSGKRARILQYCRAQFRRGARHYALRRVQDAFQSELRPVAARFEKPRDTINSAAPGTNAQVEEL